MIRYPKVLKLDSIEYRKVKDTDFIYVSETGLLYNLELDKPVKVYSRGGYLIFSIRVRDCYKLRSVHRAVAFAWVHNPEPGRFNIVNHKDGVPMNNDASNLEWTTYTGNNLHAVNSGLRPDNISCKVRNFETKEIREFPSVNQACEFMGLRKDMHVQELRPKQFGALLLDRYEFRYSSEETPWFYENRTEKIKPVRYIVTVKNSDGTCEEVFSNRSMLFKYKLYDSPGKSIPDLVAFARILHPDKEFSYADAYVQDWHQVKRDVRPVKRTPVKCSKRSQILEFDSVTKTALYFNVDRSVVINRLVTGENYRGWVFTEN
jgi:hypothetical protein